MLNKNGVVTAWFVGHPAGVGRGGAEVWSARVGGQESRRHQRGVRGANGVQEDAGRGLGEGERVWGARS